MPFILMEWRQRKRETVGSSRDQVHFPDSRATGPDPFPPRVVLPDMLDHWYRGLQLQGGDPEEII